MRGLTRNYEERWAEHGRLPLEWILEVHRVKKISFASNAMQSLHLVSRAEILVK